MSDKSLQELEYIATIRQLKAVIACHEKDLFIAAKAYADEQETLKSFQLEAARRGFGSISTDRLGNTTFTWKELTP